MRSKSTAIAVALATLTTPLPVLAVEQPTPGTPLKVGDRVRVWGSMVPQQVGGELIEVGPDHLRIRISEGSDPIDVPLASVTRLQRSLGKRSAAGKGARKGALVGVGLGVASLFVAAAVSSDGGHGGDESAGPYLAIFGAACGATGALVSAAVGSGQKTERWETVPVGHLGVRITPHRQGVGVSMSVRF